MDVNDKKYIIINNNISSDNHNSGNNNSITSNNKNNYNTKPDRKRRITLTAIATAITIVLGLFAIYEKWYEFDERNIYKKDNSGSVMSVKPK